MRNVPPNGVEALTQHEQMLWDKQWGWLGLPSSYREAGMFKYYCGFDDRFLAHYYYLPLLARRLNDYHWTKCFEHKGCLGCFASHTQNEFGGGLRIPTCYVRSLFEEWFDGDMRQITFQNACDICCQQTALVMKPASESAGGNGVRILERGGLPDATWRARVKAELNAFRGRDMVVQAYVRQHKALARFNPSSLNTLRVTTLYLNGRFSVLSTIFRFGKLGASVDNWGAGGIVVGVSPDGTLKEKGFDIQMNFFSSANGIPLLGQSLPAFSKVLATVEQAHITNFPLCKFIGWDITLDAEENVVLVEVNASQPGLIGEQLGTGPIFGNRTQEVIDYCRSKPFSYGRALGRY